MGNFTSSTNPGSQPSHSQLTRTQNTRPAHDYLPQEDEGSSQGPHLPSEGTKAIKIAIILINLFLVINLGPLLTFSYIYVKGITYIPQIRGALEYMSANLMADPIMDLHIIDKNLTCSAGFEPLKLGTWPGTVAGCFCENGDLFDLPCENIMATSQKCKSILKTSPVEIYELSGSIWCGKRAVLGTDYVKKAECPSGYQECYPGGCFLQQDCPITKIETTSQKGFTFSKTQGELPLVSIQASLDHIPCFNQDLHAKSTRINPSYQLLAARNDGCDKYGFDDDEKYSTKLSSQSLFDSYTQNTFRYSTMSLPYFEQYSKNTFLTLSSRARMMTTKEDYCFNLNKIFIKKAIRAFDNAFPNPILTLGALIIHVGYLMGTLIHRVVRGKENFFQDSSKTVGISALLLLPCFLPLFELFLLSSDYQLLREMKLYFEGYASFGCFEKNVGDLVIRDFLDILNKGETFYLLYIGFLISNGLVFGTVLCYMIVRKVTSRRNVGQTNLTRS